MGIKAGDIVTISPEASYYTGKEMPGWVKNDRWMVRSVSGDRVVIDRNISGTQSINSPVHERYLTVINEAAPPIQPGQSAPPPIQPGQSAMPPGQSAPSPEAGSGGEMNISDRGVELIARYEGCRLEAYKCPAGVWTIGYGHTAGVKAGDKLPSRDAAKAILKEDLKKYGGYVNNCVKKGLIGFPLNQNQFDALTSFCYNCGNGSLQKLVAGRDAVTVADKLLQYNKGGGKVLAGLTRRREEERELFLS